MMNQSDIQQCVGFGTIDGVSVRFAEGGVENGPEILLLSPWPESILAFVPTWPIFTAVARVVAIDLPSFGMSGSREEHRNAEGMGVFLLRAVEALGLVRPLLVAPDVGTPAALFAAHSAPEAFAGLIVGSGAIDHEDVGGILDDLVNAPSLAGFRTITGEGFVEAAMQGLKRYDLPAAILEDYAASYEGDRLFRSIEFVRDYPRALPRLRRLLPSVTTRTRIVVGRDDPFVPLSNARLLDQLLPNSRLDVLEAGHFVWEDQADAYAALAISLLNETRR